MLGEKVYEAVVLSISDDVMDEDEKEGREEVCVM